MRNWLRRNGLALSLGLLLSSTPAYAIVNIEDSALTHPERPISATLNAAVKGSAGNSDRLGATANLGAQWHRDPHQVLLWLGYDYGSSHKQRNSNRGFAHLRYRYHLNPRYALESFGQWQKDDFARLNRRILLGGGLRITFMRQHLGIGIFHESEQIKAASNHTDPLNPHRWRGNLYLALQHKTEHAKLADTLYYQPDLHRFGDYRLLNESSITLPISKDVALKVSLEIRQQSRPPQGVKRTDIGYSTALSYSL
ncbi:MAG: DUF481 domain-containing protein [Mariprofundales bacterium]|nr:DUF481 domain-containing protein [Mariprofundales bacterium]